MAYPHSYYPIANKKMYHHVNWTWAPPGAKGNICERCGSHCFCAAEAGLLPKTRSSSVAVQQEPDAVEEQQQPDGVQEPAEAPLDGLAAILQYESD